MSLSNSYKCSNMEGTISYRLIYNCTIIALFYQDDLQEALRYGNLRNELRNIIQTAFEKVEEKVAELNEERENIVDEGPDNPLEFVALKAVNSMEDLNNFNLVEADISEMNEEAMVDKLNSDQKKSI
ncbi:unnamed protein product [Parnassius mnemosyne]|uniref:Uncharacterized protein n=1 Tax=Parnassius mnemosyne TaxID=213953 RepID=A0AAV1KVB6_9NEOP